MAGSLVSYQIKLMDNTGSVVAIFDDWVELSFTKIVDGVHNCKFVIRGDDSRVSLFALDNVIEIYRSYPSLGITLYKEFEGLCIDLIQTFSSEGRKLFTVHCLGFNELLSRRVIAYLSGNANSYRSAVAGETAMKFFADYNLAANATVPNGRVVNGVMSGMTIEADGALGSTWSGAKSFQNLLAVIREIANVTLVDFDIVGNGAGSFQFRTYNGQRGIDRTTTGLSSTTGLNSAGNAPHLFSVELGNLTEVEYGVTHSKEINAMFVLGQGVEGSREVVYVLDATAIALSTWNRREGKWDGRNEIATAGLTSIGNSKLKEFQYQQYLKGDIIQVPSSTYGLQYNWGDKVTVRYGSVEVNKKINSVTIDVVDGVERIKPKFADVI